ncbi:MAG: M48 family metalloprotease [Hydrogenophaga sp.]|nr:M48 family metalloprotease [Hydrogenophaga sp.]
MLPFAHQIKAAALRRRPPKWPTLALAASLAAWPLPAAWSQPVPGRDAAPAVSGLPSLGDGQGMSVAAERRLGDRIARDIYRDPDYLDDPVLGDYLQSIWQPLLGAARARGDVAPELEDRLAWEVMLSRDRQVNAFALPGGYLGVQLGLIAVTETPDELASVMAHELSHVSQRHIARLMARQDKMAPWVMGAMILGALAARANTDVANAALAGSQAVAAQTQLNFSRDMEREADRVGFGVLTGAGFDGQGFVGMFDKLQQAARFNDDGAFPYLRSHPLTGERIADMRARLPLSSVVRVAPGSTAAPPGALSAPTSAGGLNLNLPPPGGTAAATSLPSPALHALMAARARVLAENAPDRLRTQLQSGQVPNATPGARYAAAFAAQRLGQPERALSLAQGLQGQLAGDARVAADHLLLELQLMALATPATAAGTDGVGRAQRLGALRDQALAKGSRAGTLLGAQASLALGEAPRAASVLQAWVVNHPRDALAWQTLASANQAQGQTLRAVRAEAESRVAQRDYAGAVERFKAAQALPSTLRNADPMEQAIVDSRLRQVEELLRESLRED